MESGYFNNLRSHTPEAVAPRNLRLRLSHAVSTLRCLTIPKCYPTVRCLDDKAPSRFPFDTNGSSKLFA
eukprot:scaffold7038_cov100-Skeletonema_marinoi.AAC.6